MVEATEAAARYRAANEQIREGNAVENVAAVEEWMEARSDLDQIVAEAMDDGITLGSAFRRRSEPVDHEPAPITPLERYGIEAIVDYTVDYFREIDESNVETVVGLVKSISETIARDELLRKVLGAWMLEYTVADDGLPDGVLGRAVDKAVDQLMPYARRHRLWWKNVMESV